jgi:2'-hydroxyisoflavone reductase
MQTRRDFIVRTGAVAGSAVVAGLFPNLARSEEPHRDAEGEARRRARESLRILVLGGTGFIGPYQVRNAISRGHHVSIFTRGKHDAELPDSVERLIGDRNGKLEALEGREWDAVIDNSATNPDWVRQSAQLLAKSAKQYVYTSSTGVYYPQRSPNIDETTPVLYESPDPEDRSYAYGVGKAGSEREAQRAFGDKATILRPHYIVGPSDPTDRFPYWPVRLDAGGEVLAPGRRDGPIQFIDVRDLTEWTIRLIEEQRGGVFNASGPKETLTMQHFLDDSRKAIDSDARLTWVDDYDFLQEHRVTGVIPWVIPRGDYVGMSTIKHDRAIEAGLTYRPYTQTVKDTLAWWPTVPAERRANPKFALTREREREILAAWKARG